MNFELTPEQKQLADSVSKYLNNEYSFEKRKAILNSESGVSEAVWKTFADLGLTAITLSEAVLWAGSQSELARRLGVTAQAVSQWEQIPDGRLWQLHAIWKSEQDLQAKACATTGSE